MHTSSEREWLIIQLAVLLEYIPLPYFSAFKRFYNYIKTTTEWNLTPLEDKLKNTEYYYNVMRLYNTIAEVKPYKGLRSFENFSGLRFAEKGCPIENL
jgi:tRNA U38,U39,U40 pseudouridine synthase TruA